MNSSTLLPSYLDKCSCTRLRRYAFHVLTGHAIETLTEPVRKTSDNGRSRCSWLSSKFAKGKTFKFAEWSPLFGFLNIKKAFSISSVYLMVLSIKSLNGASRLDLNVLLLLEGMFRRSLLTLCGRGCYWKIAFLSHSFEAAGFAYSLESHCTFNMFSYKQRTGYLINEARPALTPPSATYRLRPRITGPRRKLFSSDEGHATFCSILYSGVGRHPGVCCRLVSLS